MSQAASLRRQRRHLHFDALVHLVRARLDKLPDQRRCPEFTLTDTLMAGLALFSLKDPSMLAFQRRTLDHNLRSVFGLDGIPSDTQMRTILDDVDPDDVRPLFKDIFRQVQRGKVLEDYLFLDLYYLVALDGVEYFNSKKVHCKHCMTRQHSNGEVTYYHQLLGAAIVHPDFHEVIPLAPEPIQRQDGQQKNDCERNSARRWLKRFRQEHPHLNILVIEDALSSNAPHIRDLLKYRCHFLLGVKPGDHQYLFDELIRRADADEVGKLDVTDPATGIQHSYLFAEEISLNEANHQVRVNVLHYVQTDPDGTSHEWTWVTDLVLTVANVAPLARAGRSRWRIENETFNTLKNQGYHFEHNFGHGYENLAVVMALLMMLAFLIDQVQQKCNPLFRAAWEKKGPKCALWEAMRNVFASFEVSSMREIYEGIAYGYKRPSLKMLIDEASRIGGKGAEDTS
jgi:hypothetical protein